MRLGDGEGTRHGLLSRLGIFLLGDKKLLNNFNKVSGWIRYVIQNLTQGTME